MGNFMTKIFDKDNDQPKNVDLNNVYVRRIMKAKEEMTGLERVQMVFSKNEFGEISAEFQRCIDASLISCFIGAFFGGIGRSRIVYMDFFRQNTHTPFETPLQAKRALQDKVVLGMGSGAFRIGWRLSAFTLMYMTTSTAIAAYRGKIGIIDQVGGAGLAGFVYKFRDGPKAAVSGSIFGSALGLVAGTMTFAVVSVFGLDLESANLYYYHRLAIKQEKERERMISLRDATDSDGLAKFHKDILGLTEGVKQSDSKTPDSSIASSNAPSTVQVQSKSSTDAT